MKSVTLRRPALREELRRYLLAFLLGFGSLLVVILPIIIADGGYYIYYGDYNSQQIKGIGTDEVDTEVGVPVPAEAG